MTRSDLIKRIRYGKHVSYDVVPAAPGTTPIPDDHVRLYHYTQRREGQTHEHAATSLQQGGIDINRSRTTTYGEPHVVWASTSKPDRGKVFAEFSVHKDDPRWGIGRPKAPGDVDWLHRSGADVTLTDSIKPHEILAVHVPWHDTYRYLHEHEMIPRVLEGEFDHLLDKPDSKEAQAISYIKQRHGGDEG